MSTNTNEGLHVKLPIVVSMVVMMYVSLLAAPAGSHSSAGDPPQPGTTSKAGMGAASAAATILYFPFKAAFAIAGAIVGGLAFVFSGFSEPTAKTVWITSTFGTYVITPEYLTCDRPIRFLGVENEGTPTTPAAIND